MFNFHSIARPPARASRLRGLVAARVLGAIAAPLLACAPPARNLLVITLDTTRRDHLPSYGYVRDTAPNLTTLGREGVVFEQAFAQDTNTNPSHASMFTGRYPKSHGAIANGVPLPDGVPTLAELLAERGFATGAVVSGAPLRAVASRLDRGFSFYDDEFAGVRRGGEEVVRSAQGWIERRGNEPWFLFVHLYDAHGPYRPIGPYGALFSPGAPPDPVQRIPRYQLRGATQIETDLGDYVARYDAMIRYLDDRVSELLASVDLERTLVVVLADHGESLGERFQKLDHGAQVFDEQIRIPWIMRGAGLSSQRFTAPVETVDLTPTVLDLLGVPAPEGIVFEGRNHAPHLRNGTLPPTRPIFASARAVSARHADRGYRLDPSRRIDAIRSEDWKLIRYPGFGTDYLELYDLTTDPGEKRDRSTRESGNRKLYLSLLERHSGDESPSGHDAELSPEVREQLRELGYLD
jgi:arylsulfatase A-like enzyme